MQRTHKDNYQTGTREETELLNTLVNVQDIQNFVQTEGTSEENTRQDIDAYVTLPSGKEVSVSVKNWKHNTKYPFNFIYETHGYNYRTHRWEPTWGTDGRAKFYLVGRRVNGELVTVYVLSRKAVADLFADDNGAVFKQFDYNYGEQQVAQGRRHNDFKQYRANMQDLIDNGAVVKVIDLTK